MGKVAGAAVKVAAPEAAAARTAAGKDPRKTAPGSKAAQQRQAIEDLKAHRPADEPDEDQDDEHEDQDHDEPAGRGAGPLAGMEGPATGGGFVLGVLAWVLFRAYIGGNKDVAGKELPGGADGVKRLLRAKFLNKTD